MRRFSLPLFVPADRPDRFAKAAAAGTDAIIVDLEDAVTVRSKDTARAGLKTALSGLSGADVWLRINGSGTPWHEADLNVANHETVSTVMIPKAESAEQMLAIRTMLRADQSVVALVETARGLNAVNEIAETCDRIAFGSVDFSIDMGCQPTKETFLMARSTIVLASKLAGIAAPLDGVTTKTDDADLVRAESRYALELGFGGKMLIHPQQIKPAAQGFLPSEDEVAWARKVLDKSGDGTTKSVGGEMIDAPIIERAKAVLKRLEGMTRE